MAAVVPFLERGVERGERCLYITEENAIDDAVDALRDGGLDVDAARESGTLSLCATEDTPLEAGRVAESEVPAFRWDALDETPADSTGVRVAIEMGWVEGADAEQVAERERLIDQLLADDGCVVVCQYDRNRFSDEMLSNVLRSHPLVVHEATVYSNPHYVSVEEGRSPDSPPLNVDRALERIRGETAVTSTSTGASTKGTEADRNRILLALSDDTNQRVLADWLATRYDVVTVDSADALAAAAADLCLIDATTFDRYRETLIAKKRDAEPQLLPFLFVRRSGSAPRNAELRQYADELITMPTDKATLAWRIDTLLRLRGLSARLARKNEQIEHLASAAAHDLRNPLNVAQGWLETMSGENVDRVARAHDRMETLIENVLAVAQTGDQFTEDDVRPVEFRTLVEECWEVVPTEGAELQVDATMEQTVRVDPVLCRQLFENLFRNAVKHGGDTVHVRVGLIDGVGFYVEDDGPGIPADEREAVFGDGYSTGSGGGLGLVVVKRVAEHHGWDVYLTESDAGGARFEIVGLDTVETDDREN